MDEADLQRRGAAIDKRVIEMPLLLRCTRLLEQDVTLEISRLAYVRLVRLLARREGDGRDSIRVSLAFRCLH